MQEPTYRRNSDGMMIEVRPEAQGKAAALSSYLAQGGTPFRQSGRFKKGPMKGKNVDEATAEFERKWATASPAIKQKYANRTSGPTTDLAPSERKTAGLPVTPTNATLNATRPGETYSQAQARFSEARKAPATAATPARQGVNVAFSGGGGEAGKISAPKLAIASHEVMPRVELLGVSNTVQGPPSPEVQAAMVRQGQTPAIPATPTTPSANPSNLSLLAQRELAKRKSAVDATPTGSGVMTRQEAANEGVAIKQRVNPLTGLAVGYQPGDAMPSGANAAMVTRGAESVKRQEVATSQAALAPKPMTQSFTPARPPSATQRFSAAQTEYQKDLDPAKAKAMDAVYAGSNDLDKAKISSAIAKRASNLNRKPLTPARPMMAIR